MRNAVNTALRASFRCRKPNGSDASGISVGHSGELYNRSASIHEVVGRKAGARGSPPLWSGAADRFIWLGSPPEVRNKE